MASASSDAPSSRRAAGRWPGSISPGAACPDLRAPGGRRLSESRRQVQRIGDVRPVGMEARAGEAGLQARLKLAGFFGREDVDGDAGALLIERVGAGFVELRLRLVEIDRPTAVDVAVEAEPLRVLQPGRQRAGLQVDERQRRGGNLRRPRGPEEAREPGNRARQVAGPDCQRRKRVGQPLDGLADALGAGEGRDVGGGDPAGIARRGRAAGAARAAIGIEQGHRMPFIQQGVGRVHPDDARADHQDSHAASFFPGSTFGHGARPFKPSAMHWRN